jgi:hypothetical protein
MISRYRIRSLRHCPISGEYLILLSFSVHMVLGTTLGEFGFRSVQAFRGRRDEKFYSLF